MAGFSTTVRVQGLTRTVRALERAGVEVTDLKAAMGRIAAAVVPDYRRYTPVASGRLAADYRTGNTKGRAVLYVGSAAVPYAGPINYGWPARNIAPRNYVSSGDQVAAPKAVTLLATELDHIHRKLDLT